MSFYMDTPKLTLITKKDSKDIKQLELGKSYVIGRTDQSDIILKNDYISRTHVEIFSDKGAFWIKDLGSKNGTFLNNKKIEDRLGEDKLLNNHNQHNNHHQKKNKNVDLM